MKRHVWSEKVSLIELINFIEPRLPWEGSVGPGYVVLEVSTSSIIGGIQYSIIYSRQLHGTLIDITAELS